MIASNPMTPPDVVAMRKRKGWKPDAQGRLTFRPRGLYGSAFVVETVEQLEQIEKFERTKMIWTVVVVGAVLGSVFTMQSEDSMGAAFGALVVVLALVAGLVGYVLIGGSRIVTQTSMHPRP